MALTNADRLRAVMLALGQHSVFEAPASGGGLFTPFKTYTPMDFASVWYGKQKYSADVIPTMTSETAPSGEVTASSQSSSTYAGWRAFDDASGSWQAAASTTGWIAYEFASAKTIKAYSIAPYSASTCPTEWTFDGWNGSGWVNLDSRAVSAFSGKIVFECSNATAYIKYRLNITAASGTIRINEIEMMEAA